MNVAQTFTDNIKYYKHYVLQTTVNKFAKCMLYRSTLSINLIGIHVHLLLVVFGKQLNNGLKIHDHVSVEDLTLHLGLTNATCREANFLIVGVLLQAASPVTEQRVDNNFYPIPLRVECSGKGSATFKACSEEPA